MNDSKRTDSQVLRIMGTRPTDTDGSSRLHQDEKTPVGEQEVLLRFMMANFQEIAKSQKELREQVGLLTGHVSGAALAVKRLATTLCWAAVVLVAAFCMCLFVVEYTFYGESTQNKYERSLEAAENQRLREEIWGVISLLASKNCERVSGNTKYPRTEQETKEIEHEQE